MRLHLAVFALLTACAGGGSHLKFGPLPPLVAVQPTTAPIAGEELIILDGERIIWDIQAKGFSVARAEMVTQGGEINSRVETNALASAIATVTHDLSTIVDEETGMPKTASETLVVDGELTKYEAAFSPNAYAIDGTSRPANNVHDLHTALAAIRGWVGLEAHAGYLDALVGGQLVRVEINQPIVAEIVGKQAYRVDCRVVPPNKTPFTVAIWFSATEDRAPLRFEMQSDKGRVAADLVERTGA